MARFPRCGTLVKAQMEVLVEDFAVGTPRERLARTKKGMICNGFAKLAKKQMTEMETFCGVVVGERVSGSWPPSFCGRRLGVHKSEVDLGRIGGE